MRPTFCSRWIPVALAVAAAVTLLNGCYSGPRVRRADRTSSIVDYLYPGANRPIAPASLPVLKLPLRVGVAFVPTSDRASPGAYAPPSAISEMRKAELLRRVAQAFEGRDYIASIEIVPSSYLRPGGGFQNVDQLQRLLNLDVIALVSYDQLQFTDEKRASLAYWTIIGAYFIQGNKNDTQTLMEAAVYDIASRQLLFRAPGVGRVTGSSTLLQVDEKLRGDAGAGLQLATDDMIANLKTQLDGFRARLKTTPDAVAKIEHRAGYTGGGSSEPWWALGLIGVLGWTRIRARRTARRSSAR